VVIGAGRAGMIHARNFARRIPGAELAGVVDPAEAARAAVAQELGVRCEPTLKPFLDGGADAIVLAPPTRYHAEIALQAIGSGLHILCEKPMAATPAECRAMTEAAESAGIVFQLGFMRRYDAGFREAAERLAAGEIGRAVSIRSLTYGPSEPKAWMYDVAASNGPLGEVNSHDVDTLHWLAGSRVTEVYAVAGNFRCEAARASHPDFYDTVTMTVRFENGMQGLVQGAQGVGYGYDARCEILGERGLLRVGALPETSVRVATTAGCSHRIVKSWGHLFREAYAEEDRDFIACIRERRLPRVGARDGWEALRVVLAGNRSIRERRPVRMDEIEEAP